MSGRQAAPLLILLTAACGGVDADPPCEGPACVPPPDPCALGPAACITPGPGPCAHPFKAAGATCGPVLPPSPCAPGTAPELGAATCQPRGPAACADGFAARPDGWGCAAVLPAACAGATRRALGHVECRPIGDCGRAFPPPDADLVVDPDAAPNGTVFGTLAEAHAAAAPGAKIAVVSGTHVVDENVTEDVQILGRCPEQVVLEAGAGRGQVFGVGLGATLYVEGVTLRGHGVLAQDDAEVELVDVVLDRPLGGGLVARGVDARIAARRARIVDCVSFPDGGFGRGAFALEGGLVELEDVEVTACRDFAVGAVGAGARLVGEGVVVSGTRPSGAGNGGYGAVAAQGGHLELRRSSVSGSVTHGVLATSVGTPASVDLEAVTVDGTRAGPSSAGVRVEDGSAAVVRGCTLVDNVGAGMIADDPGTTAEVRDTVFADAVAHPDHGLAAGLVAITSSSVSASGVAAIGNRIGLASLEQAELRVQRSVVVAGDTAIGVHVVRGRAELEAVSVFGAAGGGVDVEDDGYARLVRTLVDGSDLPDGVSSSGAFVGAGSTLEVAKSAFVDGPGQGLILRGEGATLNLADSLIRGVRPGTRGVGLGLSADLGTVLDVLGTRIVAPRGLGVVSQAARTRIDRCAVLGAAGDQPGVGGGLALGGDAEVVDTLIRGARVAGVVVGAGRAAFERVRIEGSLSDVEGRFGHGLIAENAEVSLRQVHVDGAAATGLVFANSRGSVVDSLVSNNAVGLHAQDGSDLHEVDPLPDPVPEGWIVLTRDTRLDGNQTRVGAGELPLPSPFAALPE